MLQKNIINNGALKKPSKDYDACCVKNVFCVFWINVMVSTEEKNVDYLDLNPLDLSFKV